MKRTRRFIAHDFRIESLGRSSVHSTRTLYSVYCTTCKSMVHEATNAPDLSVKGHLAMCMVCGQRAQDGAYGYIHDCKGDK